MEVVSLDIPDVKVIRPKRCSDNRGFFVETYNKVKFAKAGIELEFVQDNHSLSVKKGVVRGLHFQIPPYAQAKLVRVVKGSIFDVALDLRRSMPSFGQHVSAVISASEGNQILVPVGFAHGFCTLEPDTEVVYKVTNYYSAEHERGVFWNDPNLRICWPAPHDEAVLSEKDQRQPPLSELVNFFT